MCAHRGAHSPPDAVRGSELKPAPEAQPSSPAPHARAAERGGAGSGAQEAEGGERHACRSALQVCARQNGCNKRSTCADGEAAAARQRRDQRLRQCAHVETKLQAAMQKQ